MQKLQSLVETLELQHSQKRDYVIAANTMSMQNGQLIVSGLGPVYDPNSVMHSHLSEKLQIPLQYYKRMQADRPELLDLSVNHWLQHQAGKNCLLRTFETPAGNIARAFLSDRYQALDNYDVLFAVLDAIKASGIKVDITHADVTEKRLYLNVVAPDVQIEAEALLKNYRGHHIGAGNGMIAGFGLSNSEVGFGQYSIAPRGLILKCTNGLYNMDDAFTRTHLGGKLEQGAVNWSQDTRNKNLELVMAQTRDAIKTFLSTDYLGKMVKALEAAAAQRLEDPAGTVQNVSKELGYNEAQRASILSHFISGAEVNAIGVLHAITRQAQDEEPDTRSEMEQQAFAILPRIKGFDRPFTGN